MATNERLALLTTKESNGDKSIIYPITRVDAVDGLDEVLANVGGGGNEIKELEVYVESSYDRADITEAGLYAFIISVAPSTNTVLCNVVMSIPDLNVDSRSPFFVDGYSSSTYITYAGSKKRFTLQASHATNRYIISAHQLMKY